MGEERETDSLCGAGATSLAISPDGTIYPCISMKIPLGNILEENVGDVWNGERRRKLVESLTWNNTEDCKNCLSKKNCPHCPAISLEESGNLFLCNTCDKTIAECARELEVADE